MGLRRAGREGFAARLEIEVCWSALASTGDPERVRAALHRHHAALSGRTAAEAAVASLILAELELLDDRPDLALRWLAGSRGSRAWAAETRAVTAAAQVCAGLGLREDELPEPVESADPRYERWVAAFAALGDGRPEAARAALATLQEEPGRTNAVLARVLRRRLGLP